MLAALALSFSAFAGKPENVSVVLVHGAFADGSSWSKVISILQARGINVVAVQNPLTSLADDVAAVQRALDNQAGQVVLVGHSWGGVPVTQVGDQEKVKALVFVAALTPDVGENALSLGSGYPLPPGLRHLRQDSAGFFSLTESSMAADFAPELRASEAKVLAATQVPLAGSAFTEPVTAAAWKNKPSYYIVAARDRMLQPAMERALGQKLGAEVTELESGHLVMQVQPQAVADVILKAVQR